MRAFVNLRDEVIPGLARFELDFWGGEYCLTVPSLMKTRNYREDNIFIISNELVLPKLGQIIEYDFRLDEWFIVNSLI